MLGSSKSRRIRSPNVREGKVLTLRQIEVIRAVMITGTLAGAAPLLNVAAPGLSRLMKYTEDTLGTKLFIRLGGRFVPAPEARARSTKFIAISRT